MPKTIRVFLTLLAALPVQWNTGLPIFPAVLFFWFWNLDSTKRLWLGLATGIIMDSLSLSPFGTHTVIFVALGLVTGGLHWILSDTRSYLTQGIGVATLLLLFFSLVFGSTVL